MQNDNVRSVPGLLTTIVAYSIKLAVVVVHFCRILKLLDEIYRMQYVDVSLNLEYIIIL